MIKLSCFLCAFFLVASAAGQTKFERERRLKPNAVPAAARQYLDGLNLSGRVKWYFEENLLGNSVEAKVCHRKKRYSIEFDTAGRLQDIEIQLRWTDLPFATRTAITATLDSAFSEWKIRKIQEQYSGEPEALRAFVRNGQPCAGPPACMLRYELVVEGKRPDGRHLFEITCSAAGALLSTETIIFRNSDNLEY